MSSASSRAGLLFLVQKIESFSRRLLRFVGTFLSQLCLAALRIIITSVVLTACVLAMLHYMGVPVPGPAELLDKFDGVTELNRILS
jgi:hypothetical protein